MIVAFCFAMVMNFSAYWFSDKAVLKIYRAQPLTETQAPAVHSLVENLAKKAGIPKPKVYLIPSDGPNAFATGRNPQKAVVAVTHGLLSLLDRNELEGVLAHELAHVKHRDLLVGAMAATIAGAVMMLARWAQFAAIFGGFAGNDERDGGLIGTLAMAIIAPVAALIVQMAISRANEFSADKESALITGNPYGLINALQKLQRASEHKQIKANPATSHLFIVKPAVNKNLLKLFSTHPPIEERIERLRNFA